MSSDFLEKKAEMVRNCHHHARSYDRKQQYIYSHCQSRFKLLSINDKIITVAVVATTKNICCQLKSRLSITCQISVAQGSL